MPPKKNDEIRSMELRPEDRAQDELSGRDEPKKDDKPSAVDKVKSDVEPKTDPVAAIKALVEGMALEFQAAAGPEAEKVEELAGQFVEKAEEMAKAALANLEDKWAHLQMDRGYQKQSRQPAPDQPPFADPPHNADAVRSAVAHGMDEDEARAMTHMGANT